MDAPPPSAPAEPVAAPRPVAWTDLALRLVPAAILAQTLWFKFSAAPEPVWIFEQLGAEPWGRIGTGLAEALAVVALLLPSRAALGGLLTAGLMAGAVGSHLAVLGIEVQGDGGALFAMALVSLACGALLAWRRRAQLPLVGGGR